MIDLARYDLDRKGLAKARQALDMDQAQLALALGVSASSIYAWESGRYKIPPFLGLAIAWLGEVDTGKGMVRDGQAI